MANSNNICTRFINYFAVLILVFLSSSVVNASSFGGGGAGGSWGDDTDMKCKVSHGAITGEGSNLRLSCSDLVSKLHNPPRHIYELQGTTQTSPTTGICTYTWNSANTSNRNINCTTPSQCK